jgi:predicted aldo/keto reductase-like oxidoreductase
MDSADKHPLPPENLPKNVTFAVTGRSEISRALEDVENLEKVVIEKFMAVRVAELREMDRKLDSQLEALNAKERRR